MLSHIYFNHVKYGILLVNAVQDVPDGRFQCLEGGVSFGAEPFVFDFAPERFDFIEMGTVGGQVKNVHAERGSQYTSDAFTQLLDRTQAIASLSRPGNLYNNALEESGWSTLKTELLPRGACFADLQEARFELAEYLDHYDNTQRLHSALDYCTPLEIELHCRFNLS